MKLLSVTHFFEAHRGGIEIVAGKLARELAYLGHEVSWAASDSDAAPADARLKPVGLRCFNLIERLVGLPMPLPNPRAAWRLSRAARAADAVIIHDALYATSLIAFIAARLARRQVVLVQHIAGIPFKSPFLRAVMALANHVITRPLLASADQVIFISGTTADHFRDVRFRRPPLLVFNGVDTEMFRPAEAGEQSMLRAELDLPADRPILLFVGRFVEKKGLAILRELAAMRPDLLLVLAGRGPIDPNSWNANNVDVRRTLQGAALSALYRAADLFVLPSVGEGFPLVVQEAMASGLPVMCGVESAAADPVATPLLKGLPVDPARPEDTASLWADAIDEAIRMAGREERISLAKTRYSWAATAAVHDQVLRELVDSAASARTHAIVGTA